MTLADLITRCRIESGDDKEPYFISDEAYVGWLNDALIEACIRGRLLYERDDFQLVYLDFPVDTDTVSLPEKWIEIDSAGIVIHGHHVLQLPILSPEEVRSKYPKDYQSYDSMPVCVVMNDTKLSIFPASSKPLTLKVSGYRLADILSDMKDVPEIHELHHRHLVDYALYHAFSVPDAEFFDENRAMISKKAFDDYFGLPKDSDFRRLSREDVPHVNDAFWV